MPRKRGRGKGGSSTTTRKKKSVKNDDSQESPNMQDSPKREAEELVEKLSHDQCKHLLVKACRTMPNLILQVSVYFWYNQVKYS